MHDNACEFLLGVVTFDGDLHTVNSEIFVRILCLRIALKDIHTCICRVKNSHLRHDLPLVNDRLISPFHEYFIFTKLRSFTKLLPLQKFSNLQ